MVALGTAGTTMEATVVTPLTSLTPVVEAIAGSGLSDRDGKAETEQQKESEVVHVSVMTELSILAKAKQSSLDQQRTEHNDKS